jgi:protein O-GlcNAc transferase
MPKVVVGIPCFNEAEYIAGTLLSATQQLDDYTDLEIWISDNKSTDNSVSKVEVVLEAVKAAANHVTLVEQGGGISAFDNFWYLFDATDSEYFMWLGGHDQISKGYIQQAVTHMTQSTDTGLFCGAHKGLTDDGNLFDQEVEYDFSQDNPVERYLQSIAQLTNCYVFHSLFRRKNLMDYDCTLAPPGADHLIISHLLWSGKLHQSAECFYARRYFSKEDRAAKVAEGKYPHGRNNIEFYQAYLQDLKQLVQPLPDLVGKAVMSQASALLIKRFGLPFVKE